MTEPEQREAVITEAMTWLRTPHHNGSRTKGVGVDCGQFPLAVYEAAGMIPHTETGRYSPQFHLSKDEEWYLKLCSSLGKEIAGPPKRADFVLYKVGRVFSHGAIVINWPHIIHSYVRLGVTLDMGNQGWMAKLKTGEDRPIKFFTLW